PTAGRRRAAVRVEPREKAARRPRGRGGPELARVARTRWGAVLSHLPLALHVRLADRRTGQASRWSGEGARRRRGVVRPWIPPAPAGPGSSRTSDPVGHSHPRRRGLAGP